MTVNGTPAQLIFLVVQFVPARALRLVPWDSPCQRKFLDGVEIPDHVLLATSAAAGEIVIVVPSAH